MTGTDKPSKPTKLNTHRHKKRVRKNIDKKRQEAIKTNQERYGDVSGGTKVIQRAKSDIVRAPAYKPERLHTGGYHSTYPVVREGMLDGQMNQRNLVDSIIRRKRNEMSFHTMYKQMAEGKFDELDDDHKRQVMEVNMQMETETKKNKYVRELKSKHDALKDLKSQNISQLNSVLPNSEVRDKHGNPKALKKRTIRTHIEKVDAELEVAKKKSMVIKEFVKKKDELEKEKIHKEALEKQFKERFKDDPQLIAALGKSGELMKQTETLTMDIEDARETTKQYKKVLDEKREIERLGIQLKRAKDELLAKGKEDPKYAGEIARIYKNYPNDSARLAAIEQLTTEEMKQRKNAVEKTQHLQKQLDEMKEHQQKMERIEADYLRQANELISVSNYANPAVKERAALGKLDLRLAIDTITKILPYEDEEVRSKYETVTDALGIINNGKMKAIRILGTYEGPITELADQVTEYVDSIPLL